MSKARIWGALAFGLALIFPGCSQKSQGGGAPQGPTPGLKESTPTGKAAKGAGMGKMMMPGGGSGNPLSNMPSGRSSESPLVGQKAPEFALKNDDGKTFVLKDLLKKGPVLIYFYKGSW